MQRNELIKIKDNFLRILDTREDVVLVIDCLKRTMPKWVTPAALVGYESCTEKELLTAADMIFQDIETVDAKTRRFVYEHYTMIAGILPFVGDIRQRSYLISQTATEQGVSKQTIRSYLCLYLAYQNLAALAPKPQTSDKELTADEKNIRWALNKFFYSQHKNSLRTAYTSMLQVKYCDSSGVLLPTYPSFYQFRYFYRKHKNMQTYFITRDGIKDYQRNNRPLLGDGIQEFAPYVGVGMLDATVCDIYLVNDSGNLIGRPILTACIDAYSSLCCGYSLSWEGGTYSLRGLMVNILSDKVQHCRKFGIHIEKAQWDVDKLPGTFVTDMGSEYKSATFEQIAELGVSVINLPSYRPELKGSVEKFFDLVQDTYKKHLKGKGVIMPDYQERGAHDYRKDACLTMTDFEKIVIRCIIYYNCQRIIKNFPYTEQMLKVNVQPYANAIYEWGKKQAGANLILADMEQVILTLLPRTIGKFTRYGLKVNRMRYKNENYTEKYLSGGEVTVAYNPEDVSCVWLVNCCIYTRFELIESRYRDKKLPEVEIMHESQKRLVKAATSENLQAQVDLVNYIEAIATAATHKDVDMKAVRQTRKREQEKAHIDYASALKGDTAND